MSGHSFLRWRRILVLKSDHDLIGAEMRLATGDSSGPDEVGADCDAYPGQAFGSLVMKSRYIKPELKSMQLSRHLFYHPGTG